METVEIKSIFDRCYGLLVVALSSCYFWVMSNSLNDNSKILISHGPFKEVLNYWRLVKLLFA